MKSLAVVEISLNSSASKSNSAEVTLANVSLSESPANGDRPDSLQRQLNYNSYCNYNSIVTQL